MNVALRYLVQLALYSAFALFVGYFSLAPRYNYAPEDMAVLKLSLSHAAERITPCVQLTPEEIAAMPPNRRRPARCERERLPMTVELDIDGYNLVSLQVEPSGLWRDGPASVYERIEVPPGAHLITARLRDTARRDGWDYTFSEEVALEAGHYFTVTFRAETGGFTFR